MVFARGRPKTFDFSQKFSENESVEVEFTNKVEMRRAMFWKVNMGPNSIKS